MQWEKVSREADSGSICIPPAANSALSKALWPLALVEEIVNSLVGVWPFEKFGFFVEIFPG